MSSLIYNQQQTTINRPSSRLRRSEILAGAVTRDLGLLARPYPATTTHQSTSTCKHPTNSVVSVRRNPLSKIRFIVKEGGSKRPRKQRRKKDKCMNYCVLLLICLCLFYFARISSAIQLLLLQRILYIVFAVLSGLMMLKFLSRLCSIFISSIVWSMTLLSVIFVYSVLTKTFL